MSVLGAVLAGGRSRRFGSDKAVALLDGARLIDRVLGALRDQVDAVIVCGREMPGAACVADRPGPDLGPLGGINAALRYGLDHGFAEVVSVPCDAPFLPRDLVVRLAGSVPRYAAMLPVIGRWPVALADTLDTHLAKSHDRSMRHWVQAIGAAPVALESLANVNTVADLHRLAIRGT